MDPSRLRPLYQRTWAIIIGIDDYTHVSHLDCAVGDAEAVSKAFNEHMGLEETNSTLLLNGAATRENIFKAVNKLIHSLDVSADDRVLFFFAGHGHTSPSLRGDQGFLVPVDGVADRLDTLIRWTELVELFDHCRAKHVLFVLDACYSGLALQPKYRSGSQRYIRDLLTRECRQVIASGMKDQVVSDAGGSRVGNSIFTSAFLDVIENISLSDHTTLTASQMMSHLKSQVGQNPSSNQTPHFGSLFGDGDMVLRFGAEVDSTNKEQPDYLFVTVEEDLSYQLPLIEDVVENLKKSIVRPESKIELLDIFVSELDAYKRELSNHFNSVSESNWSENVEETILGFENLSDRLLRLGILIGFWADESHQNLINYILGELVSKDHLPHGGSTFLLALSRYPAFQILFGVIYGMVAAGHDLRLSSIITKKVPYGFNDEPLEVGNIIKRIYSELNENQVMKHLSDHSKHKFPLSERLFIRLQPFAQSSAYSRSNYEEVFLKVEVLIYLFCVCSGLEKDDLYSWGPPGRFLYKRHSHNFHSSVLNDYEEDFEKHQEGWKYIITWLFPDDTKILRKAFVQAKELAAKNRW